MPRSLVGRIVLAFVIVGLASLLAVGGGLFVVLRGLHQEAAESSLVDQVETLLPQVRSQAVAGDLAGALSSIRDQLDQRGVSAYLLMANGKMRSLDPEAPAIPGSAIQLADTTARGLTSHGSATLANGQAYAYAASIVRPSGAGARALVFAQRDTSGAEALADLGSKLPGVLLVGLLVGAPIAWLLARSVTAPLRRLATATGGVTSWQADPLPLRGPTEVRDLTERFNAMNAELAATRERETELLANLRHDLRTPLTVIAGFAQALSDGTATGDEATKAAQAIVEEAHRLERLVAELGAIERLQAGPAGLRPEWIDARAAAREAVERFRPGAIARGIELSITPATADDADHVELSLTADRLALDRILGNLVANALAAAPSPGGHVWLETRGLAGLDPNDGQVSFSVTDDGPGFPAGSMPHVFERFYRADPARAGSGSGLGLAIVRELAAAHGGSAHAEHVAPHGARVSVILPRVQRPPVASQAVTS
jgi:two-component system, OmpR family, sensor kinase